MNKTEFKKDLITILDLGLRLINLSLSRSLCCDFKYNIYKEVIVAGGGYWNGKPQVIYQCL